MYQVQKANNVTPSQRLMNFFSRLRLDMHERHGRAGGEIFINFVSQTQPNASVPCDSLRGPRCCGNGQPDYWRVYATLSRSPGALQWGLSVRFKIVFGRCLPSFAVHQCTYCTVFCAGIWRRRMSPTSSRPERVSCPLITMQTVASWTRCLIA